jgi:hypothetical protein
MVGKYSSGKRYARSSASYNNTAFYCSDKKTQLIQIQALLLKKQPLPVKR